MQLQQPEQTAPFQALSLVSSSVSENFSSFPVAAEDDNINNNNYINSRSNNFQPKKLEKISLWTKLKNKLKQHKSQIMKTTTNTNTSSIQKKLPKKKDQDGGLRVSRIEVDYRCMSIQFNTNVNSQIYIVKKLNTKQLMTARILKKLNNIDYKRQIKKEIYYNSQLNHTNILNAFDICKHENFYMLIYMNLFVDLENVLTNEIINPDTKVSFIHGILSAVCYMHSLDFCHLDLNLCNVVITKDGIIKIINFSNMKDSQSTEKSWLKTKKHESNYFFSPELKLVLKENNNFYYNDVDLDLKKIDVYSMAVIIICIIYNNLPQNIDLLNSKYNEFCKHNKPTTTSSTKNTYEIIKDSRPLNILLNGILTPFPSKRISARKALDSFVNNA